MTSIATHPAGWGIGQKKRPSHEINHFFPAGAEKSLCGRVLRYGFDPVTNRAPSGTHCAKCFERLQNGRRK